MTDHKRDLAKQSERMLDAIDELKRLEHDQRAETISTPPFHRLAEAATQKSHEIFEMAYRQEALGDATETTDVSIRDVERELRQ